MYLKQLFFIILLNSLFINTLYADVGQTNNLELQELMKQGVELIDIRRPEEWKQTGVVKGSHLLTFFDKKGNYNIQKWLNSFNQIVKKNKAFVLICNLILYA